MLENLIEIDHQLFRLINEGFSNSFFDLILPFFRNKLNWIPLYIFFIGVLIKQFGWKGFYIVLIAFSCAGVSDYTSSTLIKKTVKRDRPCKVFESSKELNLLIPCSRGYSFTSSHATNHFAIATFFALIWSRRKYAVLLMSWAAIVSFAQIYVGVHFPFDILAGGLLGVCIGIVFGLIGIHIIKKYIYNLNMKA